MCRMCVYEFSKKLKVEKMPGNIESLNYARPTIDCEDFYKIWILQQISYSLIIMFINR